MIFQLPISFDPLNHTKLAKIKNWYNWINLDIWYFNYQFHFDPLNITKLAKIKNDIIVHDKYSSSMMNLRRDFFWWSIIKDKCLYVLFKWVECWFMLVKKSVVWKKAYGCLLSFLSSCCNSWKKADDNSTIARRHTLHA